MHHEAREQQAEPTEANRLPRDEPASEAPRPSAAAGDDHPLRGLSDRLERRSRRRQDEESSLQRLVWFQVSQAMFSPTRRAPPHTICGVKPPRRLPARNRRPDL